MDAYKEQHVSFVSNGVGTSALCIVACLSHAPPLIYLLQQWQLGKPPHLLRDFLVLSLPALLSLTFFANYQFSTVSVIYISAIVHCTIFRKSAAYLNDEEPAQASQKPCITLFKGLNVLLTCIAILAVDFAVFPRSFGKTETNGTSVMDIGVGTFIVSTGLTSAFVRADPTRDLVLQKRWSMQHLLVLLLGFGRFVVLKVADYHEHVSEYGVHWNFFATLFCVWTSADVVHIYVSRRCIPWLAAALLVAYQVALTTTGLTEYMFSEYRADVVSANKEGIFSLCGYVPLYLLTEAVSQRLFFSASAGGAEAHSPSGSSPGQPGGPPDLSSKRKSRNPNPSAQSLPGVESFNRENEAAAPGSPTTTPPGLASGVRKLDSELVRGLIVAATMLWVLWYASSMGVQATSRRLMNFPYVCMVLALSLTTILMLHVADVLSTSGAAGVATLQYMSKHSLAVFLVANVLTGVVNMSMHTIHAPPAVAFAVLTVYTFIVTSAAWLIEWALNWYYKVHPRLAKS